jgi:hypothetical protein
MGGDRINDDSNCDENIGSIKPDELRKPSCESTTSVALYDSVF